MKKSHALELPDAVGTANAMLKPARGADAQLDHLERMITTFAKTGERAPLGCLDRGYWRGRLRALADESDLVSVQRARVLKLLDMLEPAGQQTGPTKAAA
jgi:hypothetical protein